MTMTTTPSETSVDPPPISRWLQRVDRRFEKIGDALNPILVKETRQALKSRQFVTTFSVLLFAALAWTIVGSLSLMPQIYTSPSAPRMLIGYYIVLAIPMLLVVPLAAYRSLEGEIDDGTLELLSITTLSPWQIVLGKLASAMLQMLLYYVALFPCVAYAYTLRGVDLPTTFLIMGLLVASAIVLTVIALFFAPLARSRTGRVVTLLAVMSILVAAEWGLAFLVISLILEGNPLSAVWMFYLVTASIVFSISICHLLLTATAAQLTPTSENRSTHLRVSMLAFNAVLVAMSMMAIETLGDFAIELLAYYGVFAAVFWALCGSMLAAEREVMTPRILRELPSSVAARCLLTWLTPGPVTGLVFATVNIVLLAIAWTFGFQYMFEQSGFIGAATANRALRQLIVGFSGYLVGFLVAVRFVIAIIRVKNSPRVELGLAALIAVAVFAALVPYSIGLHLNDYRAYDYSAWQITNWAWTLLQLLNGQSLEYEVVIIAFTAGVAFVACLFAAPQLVLPRRTATPERVREERGY